jgi:hypothetical protein
MSIAICSPLSSSLSISICCEDDIADNSSLNFNHIIPKDKFSNYPESLFFQRMLKKQNP